MMILLDVMCCGGEDEIADEPFQAQFLREYKLVVVGGGGKCHPSSQDLPIS